MRNFDMAAQSSSLYNEERNLLRIRERERRNQEALQERESFHDHTPLFPEPYKTSKGDELSSRIQNMLGDYEEIKELIGARSLSNLIGIPTSDLPVTSQVKPDRESAVSQHSFHSGGQRPPGPPLTSSGHRHRPRTDTEQTAGQLVKSQKQARGRTQDLRSLERHSGTMPLDKSDKPASEDGFAAQLSSPSFMSALSPLLSSLSPPIEPLSPIHSSHNVDSKPQSGKSHEKTYNRATKLSPALSDSGNRDGPAPVTNLVPSTQTFPPPLPSKTSAMTQKPTAYVRPMDGQDQAPVESPYLKQDPEDYHGESYGNLADLKANAKEKLSKLEMPSEPSETFSNDAHCVEEILKEMTHSWPPLLTAIHTPSTAETSKFSFPTKESQHVPSVKVNQKQYDASSKVLPSPQQGTSMLENDLQISDSDDDDDNDDNDEDDDDEEEEVCEKPPSSSAPPSVLQSQTGSVASAHSSIVESESSESDSSSDSESETSKDIWQLKYFMNKSSQPIAPTENQNTVDHEQSSHRESKGQGHISPSHTPSRSPSPLPSRSPSPLPSRSPPVPPHMSPKTPEPLHKNSPWTPPEETQNKIICPNSLVVRETATPTAAPRQTVGIKQPRKTVKALMQEEPKGGLKVESEPAPYRPRDQPSKEKPTVKTKERKKLSDCKEPKANITHTTEKKKHKSSHHSSSKKCSNTESGKSHLTQLTTECPTSPQIQNQSKANHRTNITHPAVIVREDFHKDKVLLPIGGNRLLSPVKSSHRLHPLVVKIELALLSRVPGTTGKINQSKSKKVNSQDSHCKRKEDPEKKQPQNHNKMHTKRKVEEVEKNGTPKKIKLDKTTKSTSNHKEPSAIKVPKTTSENLHKEHPQPQQKAMSPTPHTHKKPEKVAQKRRPSESSTCSQQSTTSGGKSSHKEPSSSKHRKVEVKNPVHVKSNKGSTENNTNPFPVPSLPNGNAKPTRPQLKFEEKLYSPEHYMKEAKKLKHKADAMSDKIGKSFNYLDAAMFFIECGIAMESDVQAPKSAYTMFAETVDLIKFIMKLKNFTDSLAPANEKAFAVLCMRCQSVLNMAMFRYKKDTAIKYSRTLGEHFKSSSRAAQAPSPCVARSTGTPSPLSPTPSPASSGGSQPGSCASNSGGQSSSVTIPQMIHHIASSYVNITSYFLYAYDIWEQADLLAKKNKAFFADLSTVVCPLALNSTMTELVHYTRQGLQWLRMESSNLTGAGGPLPSELFCTLKAQR
ncbi:LOW QUALITY PROTEIN: AF4/FMR2 family member 1 [Discoglossus pictus]